MSVTVVISEPDPDLARELARGLEEAAPDLEVLGVATTAAGTTELVTELLPDALVLFLDDGDGAPALVRAVGWAAPSVGLVLVVPDTATDAAYTAVWAGAAACLTRPAEPDVVAAAVRATVAGQPELSPLLAGRLLDELDRLDPGLLSQEEVAVLQAVRAAEALPTTGWRRLLDVRAKLRLADRIQSIRREPMGATI